MFKLLKGMHPVLRTFIAVGLILSVPALVIMSILMADQEFEKEEEEKAEPQPETHVYQTPLVAVQKKAETLILPGESDKEQAMNVAVDFISAFHSVDAENPLKYLDEAKPFMTERMFGEYEGIPKRGTLGASKVESIAEEALPAELTDRLQVWGVSVTSEETSIDGTVVLTGSHYSVLLIKDGEEWVVDGVRANEY